MYFRNLAIISKISSKHKNYTWPKLFSCTGLLKPEAVIATLVHLFKNPSSLNLQYIFVKNIARIKSVHTVSRQRYFFAIRKISQGTTTHLVQMEQPKTSCLKLRMGRYRRPSSELFVQQRSFLLFTPPTATVVPKAGPGAFPKVAKPPT